MIGDVDDDVLLCHMDMYIYIYVYVCIYICIHVYIIYTHTYMDLVVASFRKYDWGLIYGVKYLFKALFGSLGP